MQTGDIDNTVSGTEPSTRCRKSGVSMSLKVFIERNFPHLLEVCLLTCSLAHQCRRLTAPVSKFGPTMGILLRISINKEQNQWYFVTADVWMQDLAHSNSPFPFHTQSKILKPMNEN